MLARSKKNELVSGLKGDIDKANAVFLTNLIGIQSNDAVAIRKKVRDVGGKVIVTRNTLFEIAGKDTACSSLLTNLKGPNALAFAFDDAAAVAKVLKESGKSLEEVSLKGGVLGDKVLSVQEVNELADLPSRDEMLGTLLATFMAPVSALARVLHSVGEQKGESGTEEKAE